MLKYLALVGLLALVGFLVYQAYPDILNDAGGAPDNTPVTVAGSVYHSLENNIPAIPSPRQ